MIEYIRYLLIQIGHSQILILVKTISIDSNFESGLYAPQLNSLTTVPWHEANMIVHEHYLGLSGLK